MEESEREREEGVFGVWADGMVKERGEGVGGGIICLLRDKYWGVDGRRGEVGMGGSRWMLATFLLLGLMLQGVY